jgi:DNA-binding NarL/FixJ family response regulator
MDPRALNVLLVISDAQEEADIRQKLAGFRNTLFAVHAVASLAQAFQLISDKPFDTFLTDLAVPDSDGISGLQCLVAAARYAPVVIITSVYDESQALEVVRAGADERNFSGDLAIREPPRMLLHKTAAASKEQVPALSHA